MAKVDYKLAAERYAELLDYELRKLGFLSHAPGRWERKTLTHTAWVVADDPESEDYAVGVNTAKGVNLWSTKFSHGPMGLVVSAVQYALAEDY
jgi:hypothetical protein